MRTILLIFSIAIYQLVLSQNLEISGSFSSSNANEFKNSFGYGIHFIKKFKSNDIIGIGVYNISKKSIYSEIERSDADPKTYLICEIDDQSKRYYLMINYLFPLFCNEFVEIHSGFDFTLNYFFSQGNTHRFANGGVKEQQYNYDYWNNNRIGMGFIFEFEIKQFLNPRMSIVSRIRPEIVSYDELFLDGLGSSYKPIYNFINTELGLRYKLNNK